MGKIVDEELEEAKLGARESNDCVGLCDTRRGADELVEGGSICASLCIPLRSERRPGLDTNMFADIILRPVYLDI